MPGMLKAYNLLPRAVRYPANALATGVALGLIAIGGSSETNVSAAKKVQLTDTFLFDGPKTCYGGYDVEVDGVVAKWTYDVPITGKIPLFGKLTNPSMSQEFSGKIRTQICTNGKKVLEEYNRQTNTVTVTIPPEALIADTGVADPLSVRFKTDNNITGGYLKNFGNDVSAIPFVDYHVSGVDNENSQLGDYALTVATEQGSQSCAQTAWTSPYKDPKTHVTTPFSAAFGEKIKSDIQHQASIYNGGVIPKVNLALPKSISIDSTAHANYLALSDKASGHNIHLPSAQKLDQEKCLPMTATGVPAGSN